MDWLLEQNIHHVFKFPIQLKDHHTVVDFFIPPNICLYVDGDYWYLQADKSERRKQQALEPETYAETLRKRVQQYMKRK